MAGKAGAPAAQPLAQQILEDRDGLLDELALLLRRVVAHHLVLVGVTGDRMAGLLHFLRYLRILLQRGATDDPGPTHAVLGHDFQEPPRPASATILPFAV